MTGHSWMYLMTSNGWRNYLLEMPSLGLDSDSTGFKSYCLIPLNLLRSLLRAPPPSEFSLVSPWVFSLGKECPLLVKIQSQSKGPLDLGRRAHQKVSTVNLGRTNLDTKAFRHIGPSGNREEKHTLLPSCFYSKAKASI